MEGILNPVLFKLGGPRLNINPVGRLGVPPNLCGVYPLPAVTWTITGISRDSVGAALGGCTCTLFFVSGGQFIQQDQKVSDADGNYAFTVFAPPSAYRVTFDLDGSPVRAGLTLKTLTGV